MVKIKVKWGKQTFDNVEVNDLEDILTFKSRLYSLTNVPVGRQKLLYKGTVVKVIFKLTSSIN